MAAVDLYGRKGVDGDNPCGNQRPQCDRTNGTYDEVSGDWTCLMCGKKILAKKPGEELAAAAGASARVEYHGKG